jgi:hypothetical protein
LFQITAALLLTTDRLGAAEYARPQSKAHTPSYKVVTHAPFSSVFAAVFTAVHALMGIYNKLNGKNWTFHHLTEVIGHAETGTLRWGSCSTCTVPHTTISSGRHGTISLQALTLPAYCCWRGVSCCSEPLGSPSNTGFSVSNTLHAEPSRDSCKRHSVTALQLWGLQLSGAFHSIMPELQVGFTLLQ